ncbi:MAG: CHAT domain-containing protein [Saprospiraceae bacterium]
MRKINFVFLFIIHFTLCTFAQQDEALLNSILDPNVDLEEAIEMMAKDFPELLNPVVEAKKDYEKATTLANANETGQYYQQLGRNFLQKKEYEQAILYLKKSISATQKSLGEIERHPNLTSKYKDLGLAYEGNLEKEEALIFYQKGLRSGAMTFDDADLLANPKVEDLISPLLSIPIFEAKGNLLLQSDRDENQLLASLIAYERAIEILELICNKYQSEFAKLQLGEQAVRMTEKGIHAARQLFQITRDDKFKTKMFTLSDKGKAMALRSAILDSKASGLSSIPPEMLHRERSLKIKLAHLKQQLKKKRNTNNNNINKRIFNTTESLYFLQDSLKTFFPEYSFLKNSAPSLASDSLQLFLENKNSAVVEYFFGKKTAYAFVVTTDHFYVERLNDLDQIQETVLSLRELIQSMSFRTDAQTAYQNFVRDASVLYSLVLEAPLKNLDPTVDELIIIPDGPLWLVPFEILLDDQATTNQVNFGSENLPYLLKKYALTYAHSSRLLLDQKNYNTSASANTTIPFLGHAPEFNGRTDMAVRSCFEAGANLPELKHSVQEVENISSQYNGESFYGNDATRSSFLQLAPQAEIIHLSTHACMNNNDPLDSRIFFSQNDFINTEDIYNLDINAKMTMLSACQTGLGRVYNGEGMISLARAFQHAGCPSVTMSLWSVADASTTEMTTLYYSYLNDGYSKNKSLQQAKLDFINAQSPSKQHPFFWAGFVHLGDFSPLENSGTRGNKFLFLGVGIVIFLGMFVFGKKK